jgi:hypothetical protein
LLLRFGGLTVRKKELSFNKFDFVQFELRNDQSAGSNHFIGLRGRIFRFSIGGVLSFVDCFNVNEPVVALTFKALVQHLKRDFESWMIISCNISCPKYMIILLELLFDGHKVTCHLERL